MPFDLSDMLSAINLHLLSKYLTFDLLMTRKFIMWKTLWILNMCFISLTIFVFNVCGSCCEGNCKKILNFWTYAYVVSFISFNILCLTWWWLWEFIAETANGILDFLNMSTLCYLLLFHSAYLTFDDHGNSYCERNWWDSEFFFLTFVCMSSL